jgi:hypothetical protein
MALNQFLTYIGNQLQLITAIATSTGVSDAGKLIASDSSGKIDGSFLPVSSSAPWRQFTQNLSTKPRSSGSFTVTTTGLTATRAIIVMQAPGTGGNVDDIEWDGIVANGIAISATQFTCYWSAPAPVSGSKNFNFLQV